MAEAIGVDKEKPNKPITVAVKMLKGMCDMETKNSSYNINVYVPSHKSGIKLHFG